MGELSKDHEESRENARKEALRVQLLHPDAADKEASRSLQCARRPSVTLPPRKERERKRKGAALARVESSHISVSPMSKGVAFDMPDSVRDPALSAEDDGYNMDTSPGGDDVDPALNLVRTMSMSTDKDILKQLRDAMNPKQKQQTFVMLIQAGMGVIAVGILLAVVIVGYISLREVRQSVQMMADQTAQLKQITQETSAEMAKLVDNLAPVAVLPEFKQ